MQLTITRADNNLKINHKDEHEFSFDLDNTVDLNKFIKHISESEKIIKCEPESFTAFSDIDADITDEMLKLVEYIFKIINAFNESYTEIYEE